MYTILGAGISGLSVADHLNRKKIPYTVFEGKPHGGGHVYSEKVDGFTWDEGPHISFTNSPYVKAYFEANCDYNFNEFIAYPANYYKGYWIPHPAQTNLFAVPPELREPICQDLVAIRKKLPENFEALNYGEWLEYAFGQTFSSHFPEIYTRKYWTTNPVTLATDWIGKRVYFPDPEEVIASVEGPLAKKTHYISKVRYPNTGGFYSFIKKVEERIPVVYNKQLKHISFANKTLSFCDGTITEYDKLISTIPLPLLINSSDAPVPVKEAADKLKCSHVLIVNVIADHEAPVNHHWIYVYDDEFFTTRINFTELLAKNNGIKGRSGIQVEVYFSDYHRKDLEDDEIAQAVIDELISMKLIKEKDAVVSWHTKWVEWANVIFDLQRKAAQEIVFNWLETCGMTREIDDLDPMTDWNLKLGQNIDLGEVILAGRFGQWKYYWTDDCVQRSLYILNCLSYTRENKRSNR
jgi:protoporphyrinogen oxidase